jgi:hypothetical protein
MEPEQYAQLFEQIIGRKLTPSEFLEARATGFDPKEIKSIAKIDALATTDADDLSLHPQDPGYQPPPQDLSFSPDARSNAEDAATSDGGAEGSIAHDRYESANPDASGFTQPPNLNPQQDAHTTGPNASGDPTLGDSTAVIAPVNKKSKKTMVAIIAAACIVCVIGAAAFFLFQRNREIDLSNKITVTFEGYDGYGTASYNESEVNEYLMHELMLRAGYSEDEYNRAITSDGADLDETDPRYGTVGSWGESLDIELSQEDKLSNGDVVTLKVSASEETPVKSFEKEFTVENLKKVQTVSTKELVQDQVSFSGMNGAGFANVDDELLSVEGNNQGLSNGNKVTVVLSDEYINNLLEKGKAPSEDSIEIEVEGLKEFSGIGKIDTLLDMVEKLPSETYEDEPAGEYDSYSVNYAFESGKTYIRLDSASSYSYQDDANAETAISLVTAYKVTKTTTYVEDTYSNKAGDVETEVEYTYFGYQNVSVYNDSLVLSDLYDVEGYSDNLDMDAVYAELEMDGYTEYTPQQPAA